MQELKENFQEALRADLTLRDLLDKVSAPYGVYYFKPPPAPDFPLLTYQEVNADMRQEFGTDIQARTSLLFVTAFSATNIEAILDRVFHLMSKWRDNGTFNNFDNLYCDMVSLDWIGPDMLDEEFRVYYKTNRYRVRLRRINT